MTRGSSCTRENFILSVFPFPTSGWIFSRRWLQLVSMVLAFTFIRAYQIPLLVYLTSMTGVLYSLSSTLRNLSSSSFAQFIPMLSDELNFLFTYTHALTGPYVSIPQKSSDAVYTFPEGSVHPGQDNVITIDNMGDDEDDSEKSPRGITGFKLNNRTFSTWKVQGKFGGYLESGYPDKVRGVLNEGGLFEKAGVGFFVTTFDLFLPQREDIFVSFQFDETKQPYRAILFVNGWHFGKRIANAGPRMKFPVPQGILNYTGRNTVAVVLLALEDTVPFQSTTHLGDVGFPPDDDPADLLGQLNP
ncbi:unnamed protein product [Somion occarium]|uniref:Beta-galactosidase jelly roll domain-containing protein n=1 Tax=Somion occarium TaxID=3059160 RepID=A0ABP1CUB4_9APHY